MADQINVRAPRQVHPAPEAAARGQVRHRAAEARQTVPGSDALTISSSGRDDAGLQGMVVGIQRTAGNRAVGMLLAQRAARAPGAVVRSPARDVAAAGTRTVQRNGGHQDYKGGGGETVEISWTLKEMKLGLKAQLKLKLSRKGSKIVEAPTTAGPLGTESKWSLGENKATLERASGRWGRKITSALAQQDWGSGKIDGFPGLRFRLTAKGPEGKFDLSKGEVGLDLVKIQGAVDGDFIEILDYAGLAHLKDRVTVKGTFQIEKGISPADLARLKTALKYKDEVARAAKEAEEHAIEFAKHRKKLDSLTKQRATLERQFKRAQGNLADVTERLESAESHRLSREWSGPALRREKEAAEKALLKAEKALLHNKNAARVEGYMLGKASKGLAAAGKRLAAAGHRLDVALAKISDKLAKPIKQALQKVTAKIMKKLAGTLLAKGLKYLIPGLNLLMTAVDIGTILFALFSDSKEGVVGGEGDGEGTGTAGGEGPKGEGGTGGEGGTNTAGGEGRQGEATTGGAPEKAGDMPAGTGGGTTPSGGQPATKLQLTSTAKELLEAFKGDPLKLDEDAVKAVNEGVPSDLTAEEKKKLIERLKDQAPGGPADPYELVVEIQAQLAEIRAGEDTISIGGGPEEAAPKPDEAAVEPPKTLLPFTRSDAISTVQYDRKQQKFVLRPAFRNYKDQVLPPHPDGLKVKLTTFDVETTQPSGGRGQIMLKLTFGLEVVSLPAGADASYPYKVGESNQEKMTFLYNPKARSEAEAWGEMDYSHIAQLRGLLSRSGATWTLTGAGQLVHFQAATVRVEKILETKVVNAADGTKVTKFAILVVPTEIRGSKAGYTSSQGWVEFVKDKPVPITFELSDAPAMKPTPSAP